MKAFPLPDLGVIRVTGEDRVTFLQGQLTQDLGEVTAAQGRLWGWNNPRGRLLAIGQAMECGSSVLLVLPAELLADMARRLGLFVLRSKVVIEVAALPVTGIDVGAVPGELQLAGLELAADSSASATDGKQCLARVIGDPTRLIGIDLSPDLRLPEGPAGAWQLADVRAGLPVVTRATAERFVPQMVNLDLLAGISFTKGCYVGQEVVARTQNLGRIKRRMFRYSSSLPADPGNSVINADGDRSGEVIRCAAAEQGHELLAVVQLGECGGPLFAGDARLEPLPLPYEIPGMA